MTSSEIIEEILYEAHALGIVDKVFKASGILRDKGMDVLESYQEAFLDVIGETSDPD